MFNYFYLKSIIVVGKGGLELTKTGVILGIAIVVVRESIIVVVVDFGLTVDDIKVVDNISLLSLLIMSSRFALEFLGCVGSHF